MPLPDQWVFVLPKRGVRIAPTTEHETVANLHIGRSHDPANPFRPCTKSHCLRTGCSCHANGLADTPCPNLTMVGTRSAGAAFGRLQRIDHGVGLSDFGTTVRARGDRKRQAQGGCSGRLQPTQWHSANCFRAQRSEWSVFPQSRATVYAKGIVHGPVDAPEPRGRVVTSFAARHMDMPLRVTIAP